MQTFEEFKKEFDAMMDARIGAQPEAVCDAGNVVAGVNPEAEAEKACEALRAELLAMDLKLATAAKRIEGLEEELAEKQTALQNANAMAKQWQGNARNISLQLKKEKEEREKDRKIFDDECKRYDDTLDMIRKFVSKPCRWPLILGIGFCVLAILVGVCIDHDLMTCALGEPLATGLFATGTLFLGVVAERQRLR